MTEPTQDLRALRLWHWKKVVAARASAHRHEAYTEAFERDNPGKVDPYNRVIAHSHHRMANFHLGAVQVLNDFFPAGDTAEHDAAAAAAENPTT